MKRALLALSIAVLFGTLAISAGAATDARVDILDAKHADNVDNFNLGQFPMESRAAAAVNQPGNDFWTEGGRSLRPVGAVQSTDAGMGPGISIDLTYEDIQWWRGNGRHIAHYYDAGTSKASVHFAYWEQADTVGGQGVGYSTGYNMYDATVASSNWPRGQDNGCDLQETDTIGSGSDPSMDILGNGYAVLGAGSRFFRSLPDETRIWEPIIFYQGAEFNCTFDPRSGLNTTWVDSLVYRANFMDDADGNIARDPQVVTQFDGANTVVHLLMLESNATVLSGDAYLDGGEYRVFVYFRKEGNTSYEGTWSAGQVLDSTSFFWVGFDAAPYPHTGVATVHCAESYYGGLLNEGGDVDIWARESFDRGLSWEDSYSITNYTNAIADHPNHFTAWLESGCMFDSEGDLHAWWCAKPTSADPYFDGFNWNDFDENLYHWEKDNGQVVPGTGDKVKVANGTFMNTDMLTGSMNILHCGFGSFNVGYLGYATMGECDDKLYMVWGQIHERANRFPWRDVAVQPAPGVLDDCSLVGERLAMANWEIIMSVAQMSTSSLWDYPRNITNTYTPNCGIAGVEGHEEAEGPCASEWKPSLEKYALDETGLSLTWPEGSVVDMSPGGDYSGDFYLNMQYLDDNFPGPADWGDRDNPPFTLNSLKWVRLACVEPIEASQIKVIPEFVEWPEWVELGQVNNITVTVVNEGNLLLNVTEVGYVETTGSGWLGASISPTVGDPFTVPAGVVNTDTFDINIDATGMSATAWLDGEVWLKSDAANVDSISIPIHVLAAADVEPVVWDTVITHANMFDIYFVPEGECVALAVGNNGDLGWGAGSAGGINLDYFESDLECSADRGRDRFYLIGASAFAILADDAGGSNAMLTQSFNDGDQTDETGWDPIGTKGSITGISGPLAGLPYDSVYTGVFVNRDTTIAMERTVYGPLSNDPVNDIINFVVMHTKVYSGDGFGHNHVTVGNVVDWDVPSELVPNNTGGLGSDFVYLQGTDTTGVLSCQSHTGRFATEAFAGGYLTTSAGDDCGSIELHSVNSLIQTLMVDTTHTRAGVELDPDQPLADVWWTETGTAGLNADATEQDQAIWMTYVYDYNLGPTDTLNYWSILTTTRDGDLDDLEAQVAYAKVWAATGGAGGMLPTLPDCGGCCEGRVGDANGVGGDEPTIGDVSVMIDAKFITGTCVGILECLDEADINQTGEENAATCGDVTIGDISVLIDYLFITGKELGLNDCF